MMTMRAFAAILSYPTAELQQAVPELGSVIEMESMIPAPERQALDSLLSNISSCDLMDLEEQYVQLFDRTRSLSLHLFEHVHGESRDRGQAMVDLRQQYSEAGLEMSSNELPDYIPLFLEYLSILNWSDAQQQLAMCAHILEALKERLVAKQSPYAAVFAALVSLANVKPDADQLSKLMSETIDDPDDLAAIDQNWEEAAVTFRPQQQSCSPTAHRSAFPVEFESRTKI